MSDRLARNLASRLCVERRRCGPGGAARAASGQKRTVKVTTAGK